MRPVGRHLAKGRAARERRYESAVRRQIALKAQSGKTWYYAAPEEMLRRGDDLALFAEVPDEQPRQNSAPNPGGNP